MAGLMVSSFSTCVNGNFWIKHIISITINVHQNQCQLELCPVPSETAYRPSAGYRGPLVQEVWGMKRKKMIKEEGGRLKTKLLG